MKNNVESVFSPTLCSRNGLKKCIIWSLDEKVMFGELIMKIYSLAYYDFITNGLAMCELGALVGV